MQIFDNSDGQGDAPYIEWTRANPSGFVLTTNRGLSPAYMSLHTARCSLVTQARSNYREDPFTSRDYIKACTTSPSELLEFGRQNGRLDPPTPCSRCKPSPEYDHEESLPRLVRTAEADGRTTPKLHIVETQRYERSVAVALLAKRLANGRCALCEKPAPFDGADGPFLECHHIEHLARGGPDVVSNAVALCPNCHRKMHVLDRSEDVEKLKTIALDRERSLSNRLG